MRRIRSGNVIVYDGDLLSNDSIQPHSRSPLTSYNLLSDAATLIRFQTLPQRIIVRLKILKFSHQFIIMRILVIGGTGRTGKVVVEEALHRGHQVTILVRNPQSAQPRKNLKIITGMTIILPSEPRISASSSSDISLKGTPLKYNDVRAAFEEGNPEAVIVTLNARRESDSPFAAPMSPPRLMADSAANLVTAMKEFGTRKVVIMQALGVGESWANMHWVMRLLVKKSNMAYQYEDHNLVDQEVRASGVNYVLVRPARLEEREAKEVKVLKDSAKVVPLMAAITRGSVASWLVDAAERRKWDGSCPIITN
jgi:hypothetical protein